MSSIHPSLSTSIAPDGVSSGETVSPAISPAIDAATQAKAVAAAEKFEGFFIAEMLRQMRRTSREAGGDGIFNSRTHDDMLSMADDLMADALAKQHAFGIADLLLRQLLPASAGQGGQAENTAQSEEVFKSGEKTVALGK